LVSPSTASSLNFKFTFLTLLGQIYYVEMYLIHEIFTHFKYIWYYHFVTTFDRNKIGLLLWIYFSCVASTSRAEEAQETVIRTKLGFRPLITFGYTLGGKSIADAQYLDRKWYLPEIKSGAGFHLGGGGLYQFDHIPLALSLTIIDHYDQEGGSNAKITFERFPIEALGYFTGKERFRFGGGIRWVKRPTYTASINTPISKLQSTIRFDDTASIVAEVGYQIDPRGWIYFRYVSESYRANFISTTSGFQYGSPIGVTPHVGLRNPINSSHFGINVTREF
jgi:hypothetical protein